MMKLIVSRLLVMTFVFFIRLYKLIFSPMKMFLLGTQSSCRFYPTCSSYAKDSFLRFGVVKGAYLTINRVCRCHPWNKGGVDLVPGKACDRC